MGVAPRDLRRLFKTLDVNSVVRFRHASDSHSRVRDADSKRAYLLAVSGRDGRSAARPAGRIDRGGSGDRGANRFVRLGLHRDRERGAVVQPTERAKIHVDVPTRGLRRESRQPAGDGEIAPEEGA